MKQTIQIPSGCKATIIPNDNVIIIEKEDTPDLTAFEGCCAYLGMDTTLPDVSRLPDEFVKALKLWVIAKAWNKQDGFVPDYDDNKQIKYYPYFRKGPSGFAFRSRLTLTRMRMRAPVPASRLKRVRGRKNLERCLSICTMMYC